ncbi:MAG: UDP-N-acetylglucosamine 1-carboxyvinyltransferase [bacterium]|nr:UDP-N-acetylglucosamine 1-carboxyvinyltransferase [bacterium]
MIQKFIVNGGNPLRGEVSLAGAKNSGFKLMIASLLSEEKSTLGNFSKIGDIVSTAKVIEELGGKVTFKENHEMFIEGSAINKFELSEKHGRLSRASTYFVGPLLKRFGKAVITVPGGCKIGRRPLDRHLEGFAALGAIFNYDGEYCLIEASELQGTKYRFTKNTHGGTDVMIIAAALAEGETILENAAEEPEIDDLISFLNQMGAKIKRVAGRKIVIEGVKELKGTSFEVMPDRNEAVTFACAALVTKGDILVRKANPAVLTAFLEKITEIGGGYEILPDGIRFFYDRPLSSSHVITAPYPGFMTDWQALWTILMTQTQGISTIHETIFENRFGFVGDLIKMGAKIDLYNPEVENPESFYNFNWADNKPEYFHAAKVFGPTTLTGNMMEICDIRAGATLILAALVAQGKTELTGVEHVDRGYENLEERLRSLGARISRIEEQEFTSQPSPAMAE